MIHTIIRTKNATRIPQSTTKTKFGSDSEYIASGSILQRANTTGNVGCRSDHLFDVLDNEVWIFI